MLSTKQTNLIEKIGIYFEQGMPPTAARILALLIVCDKEELSFQEIRDTLGLSKSATSNGINFLMSIKKINYITKTGDRKRYFRWSPSNTMTHFKEGIEKILGLSALFEETLEIKKNTKTNNTCMLRELTGLMNYLRQELPKVFEKWESSKELIIK